MYRESFITLLLLLPVLLYSEVPMPVVLDHSEELIEQQLDSAFTLIVFSE